MTKDEALDKKANNARELGLNYEPDPVAWMVWGENNVPSLTFTKPSDKYVFDSLYMTPPQRKPLTDEEIRKANHHMVDGAYDYSFKQGVKWAEYKHGIKGEA